MYIFTGVARGGGTVGQESAVGGLSRGFGFVGFDSPCDDHVRVGIREDDLTLMNEYVRTQYRPIPSMRRR